MVLPTSYIYGDNMSVINNTSKPESQLKKKSNSICFHFVREAVAMKECLTTHVPTIRNFADLLTKVLSGKKRRDLVAGVLYDIYDYDCVVWLFWSSLCLNIFAGKPMPS